MLSTLRINVVTHNLPHTVDTGDAIVSRARHIYCDKNIGIVYKTVRTQTVLIFSDDDVVVGYGERR